MYCYNLQKHGKCKEPRQGREYWEPAGLVDFENVVYIIESMPNASTLLIIECIKAIPPGMVLSYGDVARMAGYPGGGLGARQVARILASMSAKYDLPWWRVVKKDGSIALGSGQGAELQAERLRQEGVPFIAPGKVDMRRSMYST